MSAKKNNELVSVRQAASECGRNMETIRRWIWGGKLPAQKLGNQLFIKKSDLASYCRETAEFQAKMKDFLKQAKAIREEIHERTGIVYDAGKEIRQMRDELEKETYPNDVAPAPKQGSRAELIKKMRKLREQIRARSGNIDVTKTIKEMREERINELTGLR